MMIEIDINELQVLLNKYDYQFPKKEFFLLKYIHSEVKEDTKLWGNKLEIAQFVQFLRLCGKNSYKIISTIQHPQKGKVKGSAESFTFNSSYISTPISLMAEEMLHSVSEGEYEYIFGWNEKPIIEGYSYLFSGLSDLREPYSDEELKQIIEYEKKKAQSKPKRNASIGKRLYFVYKKLKEAGYFGQSKQKEYSFLYDWYVLGGVANDIGEGYSGNIGKEKYQQVKNWITAYEKYKNNLTD